MRIHTKLNGPPAMMEAARRANIAQGFIPRDDKGNIDEYRARTAKPRDGIAPVGVNWSEHGSRTHARAVEVTLSGDSSRGGNTGGYGMNTWDDKAATWDQWGLFLAAIYEADPDARVGGAKDPIYADAEHFHWITANRYRGAQDNDGTHRVDSPTGTFITNGRYHRQHKWQSVGKLAGCGGYAWVSECACGATLRRADYGTYRAYIAPYAEISA